MPRFTRRQFVQTATAATFAVGATASAAETKSPAKLKKALIRPATAEVFEELQAAGFEGIETQAWDADEAAAKAGRKAADEAGMAIHSVMRGWTNFNSDNEGVVENDVKSVAISLQNAAIYGADAVLLVPCRVGGMTMPDPWDFDIEYDEKTLRVKRVVSGDNAAYAEYIAAQNRATEASRAAIEKLIPVAERQGVVIALENVWNNLWVTPSLFAAFVRSFDSPWVKAYFDIGNHVKYATPHEYLETLGDQIVKLHVKDFAVDREVKNGGRFVNIREGDVDWPQTRKDIADIGYDGWLTIEGSGGLSVEELSRRLDLILAGK